MRAITREVPPCFADALAAVPPDPPINVDRARRQHAAYVDALGGCGISVAVISNRDLPDGCFVEDTAVVADGLALITRPGAPSRQAESRGVESELSGLVEIARMAAPATLDGGDCMRVGTTIFVGRSARTNAAGIARLAEVFEPRGLRVVPIEMPPTVLHLKCVCAPLGDDRITLADGSIPRDAFGDLHVVRVPAEEAYAANVLALGGRVLVAAGYPRTLDALATAAFSPVELATSEFRKRRRSDLPVDPVLSRQHPERSYAPDRIVTAKARSQPLTGRMSTRCLSNWGHCAPSSRSQGSSRTVNYVAGSS